MAELGDPATDADTVAQLARGFDELTRIGVAGTALAARRAAELEAHEHSGHRNATDWLAQVAGIPFARAKDMLELPAQLSRSPQAKEAFEQGQLSLSQAITVADAVSTTPTSASRMLQLAQTGTHRDLVQEAARVQQAARSREEERHRRARAYNRRSLRYFQLPDGGVRVQAYFTEDDWGRCMAALHDRANELFRQGRSAKVHNTREQYLADAAVDLMTGRVAAGGGAGGGAGAGPGRAGANCIVRVDAGALRRGSVAPGEVCEIAGVGPISVEAAKDLLGEYGFRLLVTDGADVTTITGKTRVVPARLEAALFERDPACVVPGCGVSIGLETHHWRREFHLGGPTELDNLCRVCVIHHGLVTNGGWKLAGGPGRWTWTPPHFAVSSGLRAKRRQVNAARGSRQGRGSDGGGDGPP
jgi:hypothetical protein